MNSYSEEQEWEDFIGSMEEYCYCTWGRPCDGVLAGGVCDGRDDSDDDEEGEDEQEG